MLKKKVRCMTILLALVLTAMPLAASAATSKTAVFKKIRAVSNWSTKGVEYMPVFMPVSVSAKASGSTITVSAETTTSPVKVQIQYCPDKSFKKNVTGKTFRNKKYKTTLYTGAYKTGKTYSTELFYSPESVRDLNAAAAAEELQLTHKSYKKALSYAHSQAAAKLIRRYVKAKNKFKLRGIKNPQSGYIRVRSVYVVNNVFAKKATYYSTWKVTKVK